MHAGAVIPRKDARSLLKTVAAILILALGIGFIGFVMSAQHAAQRDYICYWSAGRQLVHHQNPYDPSAILRIERSEGFQGDRAFFMRNAPNAFLLAYPLGLLPERAGAVLWTLSIIAVLMLSIRIIWTAHGRPDNRLHLAGYLFPPVIACVISGQVAIFILLGVVLFLYSHQSRPVVAGTALLLLSFKPHLFIPFGIVLAAWLIYARKWRILAAAVSALAFMVIFAQAIDPMGWHQYFFMLQHEHLSDELIPTTSLIFRLLIDRNAAWLQFVPAFIASVWAIHYFFTRRHHWNWATNGLLLLLVSVMVAPYAWFSDEAILLPAILAGLYTLRDQERSTIVFCIVIGAALIELFAVLQLSTIAFIWTAPAWLLLYLHATRRQSAQPVSP